MFKRLDKWHKTSTGLVVFGLVELLLAYGFASMAIDRGDIVYYLLTLFLLIGFLQNLIKLVGKLFNHGRNQTN